MRQQVDTAGKSKKAPNTFDVTSPPKPLPHDNVFHSHNKLMRQIKKWDEKD